MKKDTIYHSLNFTWMLLSVLIMMLIYAAYGCTKDRVYVEHPTCRRFREFHDTSPDSINNIKTIEVHPESNLSQIACDEALTKMQNDTPYWFGCTGNYQRYRYLIQ